MFLPLGVKCTGQAPSGDLADVTRVWTLCNDVYTACTSYTPDNTSRWAKAGHFEEASLGVRCRYPPRIHGSSMCAACSLGFRQRLYHLRASLLESLKGKRTASVLAAAPGADNAMLGMIYSLLVEKAWPIYSSFAGLGEQAEAVVSAHSTRV